MMNEKKRAELEAAIAEDEEIIKRFSFTASLGNPDAFRTVHETHERVAAAQNELAALEAADSPDSSKS